MARIQPNGNPSPKAKEHLEGVRKLLGGTPNVFTTLAHSPAALGVFMGSFAALGESKLSASLRELIALTVAGANGCDYCASAHTALGKMQKLAEGDLSLALAGKSSDAKINAALSFARKLVTERGHVGDADVDSLRRAGYTDGDILDIVAVVGFNIFTNYINEVAGTEIDFPVVKSKGAAKAA